MAEDLPHGSAWTTRHVTMRFELDPARTVIEAVCEIEGPPEGAPLVLDGRDLELLSIEVDGSALAVGAFECDDRSLTVPMSAGERHLVRTTVVVTPGPAGSKGLVSHAGLLYTNLEPEGFRRLTWFQDRPDVRATYDVTLIGDPARFPTLLCNGVESGRETLPDGRQAVRFVDPVPKPSYLFSMVAGDLEFRRATHITTTGRSIELRIAAPPALIAGADFALGQMAEVMQFDELHGGIEHDLDTLTFVAVPGYPDATEYHGLMFFDPALLVTDPNGFTDDDLMLIVLNVAHEYGHHTRGNRVTVRSWDQLALKEGLTVLTGQNGYRRYWLGPSARVLEVADLRRQQFPEEVTIGAPVVREHVGDPAGLYTRTTYLKGAEIFSMLRVVMGDDRWSRVFTEFFRRHDLGAAGVDDFVASCCEATPDRAAGIDGVARWFGLAGRPALTVRLEGDDGDQTLLLERTDALTDEPAVAIPVALSFLGPDGAPLAVSVDGGPGSSEYVAVVDGRRAVHSLRTDRRVVVSPLRGYSAPVDLELDLGADDLTLVAVHDTDPVARFSCLETLMTRVVDGHRSGSTTSVREALDPLTDALQQIAVTERDPLLLAQLLAVPDEQALGDRDARIDVDGVASGLELLRAELGAALHDDLIDVLGRFEDDPYGTHANDVACRSLVDPVLALLLSTGSDDAVAVARRELDSASPTRAIRALGQLAHRDAIDLDPILQDARARFASSPRLIDRWIRAQSGGRRSDTIDRVRRLVDSELYDRGDNRRLMAVWFPFATRNRSVFHDVSGAGYEAFVDEVIALMPTQTDVVIRLVGDLLQFRRFDEHRAALMRAQLERIASSPDLPDFAVAIVRHLLTDG